jgi:deoxyribose-phosphate aldolase
MTRSEVAALLDHSVLKPEATESDVRAGADVVRRLAVGYYCVQPAWVALAAALLDATQARIVAVIGFPHGCDDAAVKAHAARLAVAQGARELDMVINLGALKSGRTQVVADDIAEVVRSAPGTPVKVILETAVLDEREKRLACRVACDAGAAFVKTSTGFHPAGGATAADVRLLRECVGAAIGVKASGGIRSLADVRAMLDAGANRIGTSATAQILAAL